MRGARAILVIAAAIGAVVTLHARQQPQQSAPPPQQPTFRGGVRTVPVYATVNDGEGGFATDLTKDDFEIKDNGAVQKITQFSTAMQPLTAILLLDGSGSMLPVFDAVLDAANSFIIRMQPHDQVRIGSFADLVQMSPTFSSNRDELLEYLKNQFNIRMANETKLWDAVHEAVVFLARIAGRKVVFLFTDGYDTVSTVTMDGITAEAVRRDVSVYAVAMWTGRGMASTRPNLALQRLAAETGGGFYELKETDEMNSTFTRIATELHLQYVLGFTPQKLDGRVHRLDVRVKQRNMKVRARRSYVADPDTTGRGGATGRHAAAVTMQ
jgi:Ca-activated chloride channel family protein